ncbi:peroxidase-related enzyme [Ruegeria pomeroyi]|uniref:Peroxidase-related enzyme n=2 Tax=Ruegeria TaxID=97050 RepID=A0A9Q3WB77_9RHOB|nr:MULTISPECIES: peroxidase-related enzyme [Ruegeria]MCE8507603.1 peroxidase-related enzyme [Ruegeria pomeroyi]MCE8513682.1 peroxidase-related enzyme [Ruegeria pomeroyi]MCE8516597.1 peroxidase-related enzyme [Ruegeria pomeroyi]MCE8519390.1 peroxidase-related enzyme [Ruegeria pomeroyi]MCE8524477.1 peroxidase-related enzyme [Ruegeria pomeroyi]
MSAWIEMIGDDAADGRLKELLDRARTPHGTVDTVMRVHSLRPETMNGHVTLYRSVLHSDDNTLPFWFLEVVASYTSILNDCTYSLTHHFMNVRNLLRDQPRSDRIFIALKAQRPEDVFEGKELALLRYAAKLTTGVGRMVRSDFEALKLAGCDDGEILEVNQVCAYFNYSNRLLNGLGCTTDGDVIGYYKGDEG